MFQLLILGVFFTSNMLVPPSKTQEFVLSNVALSQSQRECAVSRWDVQDTACGTGFISQHWDWDGFLQAGMQ